MRFKSPIQAGRNGAPNLQPVSQAQEISSLERSVNVGPLGVDSQAVSVQFSHSVMSDSS